MKRFLVLLLLVGGAAAQPGEPFFRDESFNFEFLRVIGCAPYKGADIGECLQVREAIREGDFESWYAGWYALAERIRRVGDECAAAGHTVSAREAWLRASNYYRSAEFYLHGNPKDPRILEAWGKSRDLFVKAAATFDPPIRPVRIPYQGTTLPGYLYRVDDSGVARPTLLIQTGFDGIQEELFPQAFAALERGYNVLTFEGPGQGAPLREQGLTFRPDWEKVLTPVVDYAVTLDEVDSDRIALMGLSLGGYLAP
ncbi:MAG: alpha/beta hydrolase, partial [Candidatus Eremiobacterota bacterium]